MSKIKQTAFLAVFFCLFCTQVFAIVKYDEGRLTINGIQLLQDRDDPTAYYYLPQFPRLARNEFGDLEILCMKYIGQGGSETNGGLFHALIEFSLDPDILEDLQEELTEIVSGGRIVGMVPLRQTLDNQEEGVAAFSIVSSILNNATGENPFTQNVITSGFAPMLPGSKSAIAAKLNQEGTTLLWESLQGPTSDVSVSVSGYYEAAVKAYNAVVKAEATAVYEHFSRLKNIQSGYTRSQMRKISDELVKDQILEIDVFDRSSGLGIKTDEMSAILELVTDKLIELMFDAQSGWSQDPTREVAVESNQIKGRQSKGWLGVVIGDGDQKYYTDNQYVIKKREDIRINKFYLNLSKSTSIKVPIYTSGNINGIYKSITDEKERTKYFKIVDLDDPVYQKRNIHFQVDGNFVESFSDIINFVSVNFKKERSDDQHTFTKDLTIKRSDLESGKDSKSISYSRVGEDDDDWLNYNYQLIWSLRGYDEPIIVPSSVRWEQSKSPAISLSPPFKKKIITIDADRSFFTEAEVLSAEVKFFVILNGKPIIQKTAILRVGDAENSLKMALYYDEDEPLAYMLNWHKKSGSIEEGLRVIEGDYLFLIPPVR